MGIDSAGGGSEFAHFHRQGHVVNTAGLAAKGYDVMTLEILIFPVLL